MKDVLLDTLWENEKFKSVWSVHLRLVFPTYDGSLNFWLKIFQSRTGYCLPALDPDRGESGASDLFPAL